MKIVKYLLLIFFIISFIIFLLPFLLKGILNIGNIAGMIVSLGCFLIIFFNKPLHHLIFSKIILSFIIILLAIISTCSYKILTNMNILPQEETTVVVLGCRVKNKKPSLALKERLDKTYQYLNENPKLQCILSGGQGANEEISEAKCMYQYLVSKGIDPHRLYQEDKSTSTRENILFSYQLIKKENLPKAITIITNEFHEYRAQTIARRLNIKSYAISAHTAWWLLVVLGLFMSFYALYLFLIFISIFYFVENYIFESLFLYNKTHSKKSWIPYYSKYLLGKEVALEKEGLFLMMIEIMGTILFYLSLNAQLGSLDTIIFLLFLGCILLSFIMNIYISHQIIKKVYPKYGDWITVFNVLTLGFFRSISLFLVRNK